MKDLLVFILTNLTDHPNEIVVDEYENTYGTIVLEARVHPDDMGKIIGRQGKIISAIRRLLKVKAIKEGKRFQFNLLDQPQRD